MLKAPKLAKAGLPKTRKIEPHSSALLVLCSFQDVPCWFLNTLVAEMSPGCLTDLEPRPPVIGTGCHTSGGFLQKLQLLLSETGLCVFLLLPSSYQLFAKPQVHSFLSPTLCTCLRIRFWLSTKVSKQPQGSRGGRLNGLCSVPEICGTQGSHIGLRQSQEMTLSCSWPIHSQHGEEEGRV